MNTLMNDTSLTLEALRAALVAPTEKPLTLEALRQALTPPPTPLTLDEIRAALAEESDVFSPKFWRRAWAVFGHVLAANLVLYGVAIVLVVAFIGALAS